MIKSRVETTLIIEAPPFIMRVLERSDLRIIRPMQIFLMDRLTINQLNKYDVWGATDKERKEMMYFWPDVFAEIHRNNPDLILIKEIVDEQLL